MRTFLAIDLPASFRKELTNFITDLKAQYTKSINWVLRKSAFYASIHRRISYASLERINRFYPVGITR